MIDLSAFKTSNWNKLSPDGRLEELQKLEKLMAETQSRTERTVRIMYMPHSYGLYNTNDPKFLWLNSGLVMDNSRNYQSMQTTIHEGRHAYQDDCIRQKILPQAGDENKVELWRHNFPAAGGVYNKPSNGYTDYRFQPVETDANNFAKEKLDSFSVQLRDDAYGEFIDLRNKREKHAADDAAALYGDDYEQVIKESVERKYQAKSIQESKDSVCLTDNISIPNPTVINGANDGFTKEINNSDEKTAAPIKDFLEILKNASEKKANTQTDGTSKGTHSSDIKREQKKTKQGQER